MNINELDSYNLDDAVKFNQKLNPRIWGADEKMLPQVRDQLLRIADDFREFLGIDIEVKDITVSGSNAAYTYTPHSDIDLHLVVDLPEADANEVYRELFDAKKYAYNEQHNIKIGGYDVELYVQDANKTHHSQGIYSIKNNDWVSVPKRRRIDVDDISVQSKFEDLGHRIESAIASGDYEKMSELSSKIREYRQAGLDAHGEFGPENLAFKILRTQGLIKKLYDARNAAKDDLLSLDERKKKKKKSVRYGFGGYWYPGTAYAGQDHPAGAEGGSGDGGGGESLRESAQMSDEDTLRDFVNYCAEQLDLKRMPTVKLRRDPQWSVVNRTFGRYQSDANTLEVAFGQRHIMDVLRTVAHELTHQCQHEREDVPGDAGETGSPYENEANARAGVLMRDYGQLHPELFDTNDATLGEGASGYIPTRAQAKDPRFSTALTVDIKPGQVGKEANKLKLKTNRQGQPQIAKANGLFEELMLEFQLSKEGIDAPINKTKDSEQYYKFIVAKHKMGRPLTRQEQEYIRSYKMFNQKIAESTEVLDEVKMSPSALQKWANSPEAAGIRAGFEAELIFRDTQGDDEDDYDMEPDYDADERAYSIQQVIEFFSNDDWGYGLSDRQIRSLENELDETYMNWRDEQMMEDFQNEAEDLVREIWLEERPMNERILSALSDGMGLDDAEADKILIIGDKAPRFTKSSEQMAYKEANPGYDKYLEAVDIADAILDEEVEASIDRQDGYYDQALDNFRDNYSGDDDSFFSDVGLRWMSDVANNFGLDWPYMTGGGSNNNGSRSWDEIGNSLQAVIDMPVKVSSNYHSTTRKEGQWIIEPDGSLDPDDKSEEVGLEIVSPPMPLLMTLEKLKAVTDWANNPSEGNAYTNSSTGLHMGVSIPFVGGDVDYVKLIMFMGDKYVLEQFGRASNTYTASAMDKLRQNLAGGRSDPAGVATLLKSNLAELAFKELQKGVGTSKYTSAHIQNGYIEFRSPGGDWLAKSDEDIGILENTMMRFAQAMYIASRADLERNEYAKKLYKLISEYSGDSDHLKLFAEFNAGIINKEQLKKQWAEKTIGKETKTNQRWKLYQNVDGRWEPVPAAEWNGYTEDQVKTAVWSKYGREALESGEYKLVNMSEEQQWEVYDVKTGQTLEIVKGRNKGEVADAVYDKYVDQGIGFNVRAYVDPATLTPRAKLAKRITTKKIDYNYDIIDRRTVDLKVVDRFYATDDKDASETFDRWLKSKGLPSDEDAYGYRKGRQAADNQRDSVDLQRSLGVQDVDTDVAQNFTQPQDATQRSGSWSIYDVTLGREISRMDNVPWQQANDRANELERSTGHNMSVRGLSETIDPVSGAGAVPPRQDPKNTGKKNVTPVEKAFQNPVKGQPYRSAIGQAISKKDLEDMTQQIKIARKLGDSVMEMEDPPPEVMKALDQAAQKNGYRNWADVKANPRSTSAVMTVAKLANTIMKTTGTHHPEKIFYKNKLDK
jgi:hypothetical protein